KKTTSETSRFPLASSFSSLPCRSFRGAVEWLPHLRLAPALPTAKHFPPHRLRSHSRALALSAAPALATANRAAPIRPASSVTSAPPTFQAPRCVYQVEAATPQSSFENRT